jgi:hypothetical protein
VSKSLGARVWFALFTGAAFVFMLIAFCVESARTGEPVDATDLLSALVSMLFAGLSLVGLITVLLGGWPEKTQPAARRKP